MKHQESWNLFLIFFIYIIIHGSDLSKNKKSMTIQYTILLEMLKTDLIFNHLKVYHLFMILYQPILFVMIKICLYINFELMQGSNGTHISNTIKGRAVYTVTQRHCHAIKWWSRTVCHILISEFYHKCLDGRIGTFSVCVALWTILCKLRYLIIFMNKDNDWQSSYVRNLF
jgi:hypothetical protein